MNDDEKKESSTAHLDPWKWKKGSCPNPGGRPSKRQLLDPLRNLLRMEVPPEMRRRLSRGRRALRLEQGATFADLVASRLILKAALGDHHSIALIFKYCEGLPAKALFVAGQFDVQHSNGEDIDMIRASLIQLARNRNSQDGSENSEGKDSAWRKIVDRYLAPAPPEAEEPQQHE